MVVIQAYRVTIGVLLPRSDLVGDFVVSMHTEEELRQSHRRLVDLLRADRPVDATSKAPEWNISLNSPTSQYVSNYCVGHVRQGWDLDWENDEHAIQKWLGDYPQARPSLLPPNTAIAACSSFARDRVSFNLTCCCPCLFTFSSFETLPRSFVQDDIVVAAASFLGFEKVSQLASKAEAGDTFEFAKLAVAAARWARIEHTKGSGVDMGMMRKAVDALGVLTEGRESEQRIYEERLELETICTLLGSMDAEDFKYLPRECTSQHMQRSDSALCSSCFQLLMLKHVSTVEQALHICRAPRVRRQPRLLLRLHSTGPPLSLYFQGSTGRMDLRSPRCGYQWAKRLQMSQGHTRLQALVSTRRSLLRVMAHGRHV